MKMLIKGIDAPALPYDVLRLVFEEATRSDRRKAATYALTSKLVCIWVEGCLYSDVQLCSGKSLGKFLRTLESSTKSRLFFATHVKSLTITYNMINSDWTARVLSACNGVETLTIWAIPSHRSLDGNPGLTTVQNVTHPIRGLYLSPQSSETYTQHLYQPDGSLYDILANYLRPRHLAILIDNPLYTPRIPYPTQRALAPVMSPNFSLALFAKLTHLSIVNRWTEWSTWVWSWSPISPRDETMALPSSLKFLPRLTHLSLDIQVGKRLMSKTSTSSPSQSTHPHLHRIQKLAEHLGLPLATILTSPELNPHLHVLLCILSFDEDPHRTAQAITEQTQRSLAMLPHEHQPRSSRVPRFDINSPDSDISDPRLVFAYDREPFREREAGSSKVWEMWRRAEEIVGLRWRNRYVATSVFEL